jgi:DNA topoisomerase VI subunit B
MGNNNDKITSSSTAEYFSKNLQQVGFSSHTKAVLTVVKEAVDNSLDACEDSGILPEVTVTIEKLGPGTMSGSDQIRIRVDDNGPGINPDDITKVFGEYLSSSKFGRGRCSRGQQGIGISAATTWAQLTNAKGVAVITKRKEAKSAIKCLVEVDIKNNKGVIKDKETIAWDKPNGTTVEFIIDGRIQANGELGLINYLTGTALVNPHLTLNYKIYGFEQKIMLRVSTDMPVIPDAVEPHPHTLKLGEFIGLASMYGKQTVEQWLKKGLSRINEATIKDIAKNGAKGLMTKKVDELNDVEIKALFKAIQDTKLLAPMTKSVMSIGEDAFSKSMKRLGSVNFFSIVSRTPCVCDFKPVLVEVAIARIADNTANDTPVQVLRFANRVPLQFDKSSCAIVKALESVNWKAYGLNQPKNSLPVGPYIIAVSIVSPFIKFKNASKETIDASDELVEEIRKALIQAGQRLSKHIKHESKALELEKRLKHIEQFCPVLLNGLCHITGASKERKIKAQAGLVNILGRDAKSALNDLEAAETSLKKAKENGTVQNHKEKGNDLDDIMNNL